MSRYDEWETYYVVHDDDSKRRMIVHARDIHTALLDALGLLNRINPDNFTITKIERCEHV